MRINNIKVIYLAFLLLVVTNFRVSGQQPTPAKKI